MTITNTLPTVSFLAILALNDVCELTDRSTQSEPRTTERIVHDCFLALETPDPRYDYRESIDRLREHLRATPNPQVFTRNLFTCLSDLHVHLTDTVLNDLTTDCTDLT